VNMVSVAGIVGLSVHGCAYGDHVNLIWGERM